MATGPNTRLGQSTSQMARNVEPEKQLSMLESLINRQGEMNNQLNRTLVRLVDLADRILSSQPTSADSDKDPGPIGGTIGNLEWTIMHGQFIADRISEQVARLESL